MVCKLCLNKLPQLHLSQKLFFNTPEIARKCLSICKTRYLPKNITAPGAENQLCFLPTSLTRTGQIWQKSILHIEFLLKHKYILKK